LLKASTLKRSIRIGVAGQADKEVRIGECNHNPEEMLLVAALFNGTPACTQANNEQKFSLGIDTGGQLVVFLGKAVDFRRTIIGMINHNGHQRRKGFVDPTAKAKAASAAEAVYARVDWRPGNPIPALA
jgi:hypothetical protein